MQFQISLLEGFRAADRTGSAAEAPAKCVNHGVWPILRAAQPPHADAPASKAKVVYAALVLAMSVSPHRVHVMRAACKPVKWANCPPPSQGQRDGSRPYRSCRGSQQRPSLSSPCSAARGPADVITRPKQFRHAGYICDPCKAAQRQADVNTFFVPPPRGRPEFCGRIGRYAYSQAYKLLDYRLRICRAWLSRPS